MHVPAQPRVGIGPTRVGYSAQHEHGPDHARRLGTFPEAKRPPVSNGRTRARAALGSVLFLAVAPGVVAGLLPWWLTGWRSAGGVPLPVRVAGVALVAVGVAVLLHAFARFVVEGLGTPSPLAPTRHLVIGGLYRYVRNPMYIAVAATIIGQAMLLGRPGLLLYAFAFGVAVGGFVRFYEEPTLTRQFGAEYDAYRRAVPAWWPRRRAWSPDEARC
jgi:protein-S-isoprenylcysteine O-methyltransferase Ste14